jgi:hypothetical protein
MFKLLQGVKWSEREDLNLRPLVSQTSALTGLRHAPSGRSLSFDPGFVQGAEGNPRGDRLYWAD